MQRIAAWRNKGFAAVKEMTEKAIFSTLNVLILNAAWCIIGRTIIKGGHIIMKSVNIKLSLAENVKSFVNVVNRYPYDVDLRAGRHVVDAKSILGIFSLDLSKPIVMEIYTDSCDDLMEDIKPFMA